MNTIHLKRLNGVDVIKFIMAFAVVTIHVQSLFKVNYAASINWFIGLAVPYFFIVSGFLTARRLTILDTHHDKIKYLRKRALRFQKMFLLWLLIFLPISLIAFDYSSFYALLKDIARYVINVILLGESKYSWPLWYLYSSMIAYFILSVLSRWKRSTISALLFAAFIIAGLVVLPHLILPKHIAYCVNGIFQRILGGFPYILTGILLYKYGHKANNAIFILFLLALSCTAFYFDVNIYPLLGGVALFMISYKIVLPDNDVYNNLNTTGIWIYLTHMLNLLVIKYFLIQTNIPIDKYVLLFISFLFTFITSSVINLLSKTNGFMWLKKLI